jgi:hypothetical protein
LAIRAHTVDPTATSTSPPDDWLVSRDIHCCGVGIEFPFQTASWVPHKGAMPLPTEYTTAIPVVSFLASETGGTLVRSVPSFVMRRLPVHSSFAPDALAFDADAGGGVDAFAFALDALTLLGAAGAELAETRSGVGWLPCARTPTIVAVAVMTAASPVKKPGREVTNRRNFVVSVSSLFLGVSGASTSSREGTSLRSPAMHKP